jgi:hypothetical protein
MVVSYKTKNVSNVDPVCARFAQLIRLVNEIYGTHLVAPQQCFDEGVMTQKKVKGFCGGILEPHGVKEWGAALKKLSSSDRFSVKATFFMFRKICAASTPDVNAYLQKMSVSSAEPDAGFIKFITQEVNEMFPVGWDRGYDARVLSATLSLSSCIGSNRAAGGVRGIMIRELNSINPENGREQFVRACIGLDKIRVPTVSEVLIAKCDGKERIVTKSPAERTILQPFHQTLYDFISKQEWLLRGEATTSRFNAFTKSEGEVFVSGDYESATDNLDQGVSSHILSCIARRCHLIPIEVRDAAVESLSGTLCYRGKIVDYKRGQLMGNYMSFPLLCLYNYLAFRYIIRRKVPIKINGDDIIFRATLEEAEKWKNAVGRSGLTLSLGKTMISGTYFSLNSTFFRARSTKVEKLSVIRSTTLFKPVECASAVADRLSLLRKVYTGNRRDVLMIFALRQLSNSIHLTQRSVVRGLGARVKKEWLMRAGLWQREVFYLNLPSEPSLPIPKKLWRQDVLPDNWERRSLSGFRLKVARDNEKKFFREMLANCWTREPRSECTDEYWESVRENTFRCSYWIRSRKEEVHRARRMLSLSTRAARAYLRPKVPKECECYFESRAAEETVWVEKSTNCTPVFVRSSLHC